MERVGGDLPHPPLGVDMRALSSEERGQIYLKIIPTCLPFNDRRCDIRKTYVLDPPPCWLSRSIVSTYLGCLRTVG